MLSAAKRNFLTERKEAASKPDLSSDFWQPHVYRLIDLMGVFPHHETIEISSWQYSKSSDPPVLVTTTLIGIVFLLITVQVEPELRVISLPVNEE